jgi:hypothetical protein
MGSEADQARPIPPPGRDSGAEGEGEMRERFADLRVLRIVPGGPGAWQRQDGLSVPLSLGPFL